MKLNSIDDGREEAQRLPMKRLAALQKNFRGRSTSFCRLCVWVVLFATLFASTPAVAQSARESSHVKRTYMNSTANEPSKSPLAIHQPDGERKMNALTMAIRGGAGVLLFPVNLVRDYVKDHSWILYEETHDHGRQRCCDCFYHGILYGLPWTDWRPRPPYTRLGD